MGLRGRSLFGDKGHVFFVTTTVVNFGKVFDCGEQYFFILRDSLVFVLKEHSAQLLAYVFMPSHIHMIVAMPEGENISDLMRDFKKYTSTKIRQQLEKDNNTYWLNRLRLNAQKTKNQSFKLWMDRFDDFVIESEKTLKVRTDYIHANPVKAGLTETPEEWKFSSARNYSNEDNSVLEIATDWMELWK